jgi:hypothetical protein
MVDDNRYVNFNIIYQSGINFNKTIDGDLNTKFVGKKIQ